MDQEQPAPQELKRPWYYSTWFLAATFILGWPVLQFILLLPVPLLWPVWAILILRSPWHRNFITGTTAWAMLMSGGFLVITQFYTDEMHPMHPLFAAVIIAPGLLLAAITQFFWNRDRKKFDLNGSEVGTDGDKKPSRVRAPRQVRRQHRRGSRPGRSSRHPH